jgi:nuclear control of ATPase protein 2
VGVAPAFAIVYIVGGYIKSLWTGGRGRGQYGGKKKRAGVWVAIRWTSCLVIYLLLRLNCYGSYCRRIERLLVFQPKFTHQLERSTRCSSSAIPALTSGLLLLSVTHLRTYAETCLPARSGLREGFLEDVQDLEDPGLGRTEKLRVVDRMWNSWGEVLGWGKTSIWLSFWAACVACQILAGRSFNLQPTAFARASSAHFWPPRAIHKDSAPRSFIIYM